MNLTESLKELEARQRAIQSQIKNCPHEFGSAIYDPEIKKEFTYQQVTRGSDVYPEPIGSYDKQIDRWSRECKKCGFKQYTYEKAPVIERYEPKFD